MSSSLVGPGRDNARVLLVGSAGFVGKNLLPRLKEFSSVVEIPGRSNWEVFFSSGPDFSSFAAVYWCASTVNPSTATSQPNLVIAELKMWESFVLALSSMPKSIAPKVIFISSGGCVYTDENEPFTEESNASGTNEYGRMKLVQEQFLIQNGGDYAILRAGNIYGPGQSHGKGQGVIANWIHSFRTSASITLYGSLDSSRDYLFIDDFTDAILRIGRGHSGLFNVSGGVPTSLRQLLEVFLTEVTQEVKIEHLEPRIFDRHSYWLDNTKIEAATKWAPRITLENGIKASLGI